MTKAMAVVACPVCGKPRRGRYVSVADVPSDQDKMLATSLNAVPGGVGEPVECWNCRTVYGIDRAKIFVVVEDGAVAK